MLCDQLGLAWTHTTLCYRKLKHGFKGGIQRAQRMLAVNTASACKLTLQPSGFSTTNTSLQARMPVVSLSQPPRQVKPVRGSSSPPTHEPDDWTETRGGWRGHHAVTAQHDKANLREQTETTWKARHVLHVMNHTKHRRCDG